jgi:hypothetical protein
MGEEERRTPLPEYFHQGPPFYCGAAGDAGEGLAAEVAGLVAKGVGVGMGHGVSPFPYKVITAGLEYNTRPGHMIMEGSA